MTKITFNDFLLQSKIQKQKYVRACQKVIDSGWYILGQEVEKFEHEFAAFLGVKFCIGVANGLEALQISLMALNIGAGDEVITTPFSAVATTLAILAVGAKPVFVDVDENGLINADLIEKAITKKTKAILPVHLFGHPVNLIKIKQLCKKYQLFLIEDAAQAHGSQYRHQYLGTFGDLGCFSFYPTKNLGAIGDGGAIVTNNKKLADECKKIANYGQKSKYVHTVYGLNSRLDELQAAILRIKLPYLATANHRRRQVAKWYQQLLSSIPQINMIEEPAGAESNYHLFVIVTEQRNQLQAYLKEKGIETLVHYPLSIPDQPFYQTQQFRPKQTVWNNSRHLAECVLSLPCYSSLSLTQVKTIVSEINHFFISQYKS